MDVTLPLNKQGNRRGMVPASRRNLRQSHFTPFSTRKANDLSGEVVHSRFQRAGPPMSLVALLKAELMKIPPKGLDGQDNVDHLSNAQIIAAMYIEEVKGGNSLLLRDLLDRVDGKSTLPISVPGGVDVRQEVKVISQEAIQPALDALIACGAVSVCRN